ncbi:MAG: glycosyltransferase [Acidobacteriota bacterium]
MPVRTVALVVGQLQVGGAERQLHDLAVQLDRDRYRPLVICLSDVAEPYAGRLRGEGVEVEVLHRSSHRDPRRIRGLADLLIENDVALSHSFLLAANAYTAAASWLAGRRPFIASSRTSIPPNGWLSRMIHRRAFLAARAIIANARRVMEFTRDEYRIPQDRFRVIHNGVRLEDYHNTLPEGRIDARARLKVAEHDLLVGTLGRVSAEKNLGMFLRVCRRLLDVPELKGRLRFVLAGDGPALPELRAAWAREGLAQRMIFTGPCEDVPRLLAAMDIFLLTSDTEGLPNSVMEAMAASRPVVATRVGGTDEIVIEATTGYLVDPRDEEAMRDRVTRLALSEPLRRTMGGAARRRIQTEFSSERMVARTTDLYADVLGRCR